MTLNPLLGLLAAFLALSLIGCASQQTRVVTIREYPPDSLLIPTPIPDAEGRTNSDLMTWASELRCSIIQANADKAALMAWKAGIPYSQDSTSCDILDK